MSPLNQIPNNHKKNYKWIYDSIISRLYDFGLKIGLTPSGERILRESVFYEIAPFVRRNDRILDLCCGTGTLTILLANLVYSDCEIIGIDISHGQISRAMKKNNHPNLRFEVMDANNLRFQSESFNIVIISAALHEMKKSERLRILAEIYRVLRTNSFLLIFEHHEPGKIVPRILYNFYLGFWEKLLSQSFNMQRNISNELISSHFKILKQKPIKKVRNFFQIILCKKLTHPSF